MNQNYLNSIFLKLKEIKKNAYVPYSKFKVGAICRVNDEFYYGVNIENAAYPTGNCAERSAICAAISKGHKKIDEVYIITDSKQIATPCGVCRQFISEFMDDDNQKIVVFNVDGDHKIYTIKELLLDRFSRNDLNDFNGGDNE